MLMTAFFRSIYKPVKLSYTMVSSPVANLALKALAQNSHILLQLLHLRGAHYLPPVRLNLQQVLFRKLLLILLLFLSQQR